MNDVSDFLKDACIDEVACLISCEDRSFDLLQTYCIHLENEENNEAMEKIYREYEAIDDYFDCETAAEKHELWIQQCIENENAI